MERSGPYAIAAFRLLDAAREIACWLTDYEVICVSDGISALDICRRQPVGLVVAEAILPGLDGFGLARRLRTLDMVARPGIILVSLPEMPREIPETGCAAVSYPASAGKIIEAEAAVRLENRLPSPGFINSAAALLDRLGIPEHCGREYLMDAIFLSCEDRRLTGKLTRALYPLIGERHDVSSTAVERAMRRAIETAWNKGSIETQYEIFKDTIDAAKGKPTCGEMIAQLSEILRMEG